jgi:hypothetical protein
MAFPTAENSQITDSVCQTNAEILGDAAAMAVGSLFLPTSQALSNAAHNAVTGQQQTFETANATTVQGVSLLLCLDTASTAKGTSAILDTDKVPVSA